MNRISPARAGFTLLEIMIVVLIIGLLIGVAVKGVNQLNIAKDVAAHAHIQTYQGALVQYSSFVGNYPTTEQGLKALIDKPSSGARNWRHILDEPILDPWQHEYNYVIPGKHNPKNYDLYSSGPDGIPDTADDIGNWENPQDK